MFNLGMMEILLVLAVAFLVVGPKDLPKVARWLARQLKSLKKLVREIKKETGWDEFAKEFKDVDIRKDIQSSADELRNAVNEVRNDVEKTSKEIEKDIEG